MIGEQSDGYSRIRRMFGAVFLGKGLLAIRQIISVPVLITAWGADYYGSWLVLSAIPTFLSMSNSGLGASANLKIAADCSAGGYEEAQKTFTTSLWIIFTIGILVVIFSTLAMTYVPFLHPAANLVENPILIVALLLMSLVVNMLGIPLLGFWTGHGLPSGGHNFLNYFALGSLFFSLTVPLVGGRALETSTILLVWSVIWLIVFQLKTYFKFRNYRNSSNLHSFDFKIGKVLFSTGLGHQFGQLWQAIFFQGSLVLAGISFGPTGAALWGSMRILGRSGNQAVEVISQSLSPEFQINFAKKKLELLRSAHAMGLVISVIIAIIITVLMIFIGPVAYKYWTRHTLAIPILAWTVLCASVIPFSIWNVSAELQRSINQPWLINVYATVAALLSVAVMCILSSHGIIALSTGVLLFEVLMVIFVIPKTTKILQISIPDILRDQKLAIVKLAALSKQLFIKIYK